LRRRSINPAAANSRKAGTRVSETPVRRATLEIAIIRQEVEAFGAVYSYRLILQETRALPSVMAARMGCPMEAPAVWIEALHLADDKPFAHETRWLNAASVRHPLPQFDVISANEWLVKSVSYLSGDIAFSAEPARDDEARIMGITAGSALFITERMTWSETEAITWVRLAHAPGYRLRTLI
jgi:GntR family histidine utilization transcriptional repressor